MSSLALAPDTHTDARLAGEYRLERRLGRGAMGEVWLGRHLRTGAVAAIKMIRGGPRARERVARFFARERRAVARLSHPNIVALFDVGPDYIATAYIDGSDLARRLESAIEPARALEIALQIASALSHAHEQRIVHRDVKPSNILLDSRGNAYLSDFGLATLLDDAEPENPKAGTPHYMAPEQARGLAVGPAADQFALARTLNEMLAGGRVARDPDAALHELPASVPPSLAAVLRRATATAPADRWPSVADFASALRAVAGDVAAAPAPQRLLPESRPRAPFAWAGAADDVRTIGYDITRADYRLATLAAANLVAGDAVDEFRRRTAHTDFGWSVLGRADRLDVITDPSAFARATEVVVLLHGMYCTRETWMRVAAPLARDNAHALILVPDLNGFGVSRTQSPSAAQVSPRGMMDAVLAWLELIGVRHLPMVLVGHSFAATALLTCTDAELGPRTSRVALTPVFPSFDRTLYVQLRALAPLVRGLGVIPGMRRLIGKLLFLWSSQTKVYSPREREAMLDQFLATPVATVARACRALAVSRPATGDPLHMCSVIVCEEDPVASLPRTLAALERLGVPERSIHRLATDAHQPHAEIEGHPEWTQRNLHGIVTIIDNLMVSSRDGSIVSAREQPDPAQATATTAPM